jgi:hypothetical protein
VKRPLLQFSLRGLLGFSAIICLLLGGWHLLNTYGNYMEVGKLAVGKPIRVKGRFIRVFGPKRRTIAVGVSARNIGAPESRQMGDTEGSSRVAVVDRSWLCCYEFDRELDAMNIPGQWVIFAGEVRGMGLFDQQWKTFVVTEKWEDYP